MARNAAMHQGDLVYRIERLEQALIDRTSGRSLENSSIGAGGLSIVDGGSLEIDGGELRLVAPNGVTVARWGDVSFGGVSRGWEMNYADGKRGLIMGGTPGQQALVAYDQSGNYVVSTDGQSRVGLARPFLNYNVTPAFNAHGVGEGSVSLWPSTDSTAYRILMEGDNSIWHPKIRYKIRTTNIGGGGGGTEWRLMFNDTQIATGQGNGTQTYTGTAVIPGWGDEDGFNPGQTVNINIEARMTGDATRSWIQHHGLIAVES